jgi:hypothetical protein
MLQNKIAMDSEIWFPPQYSKGRTIYQLLQFLLQELQKQEAAILLQLYWMHAFHYICLAIALSEKQFISDNALFCFVHRPTSSGDMWQQMQPTIKEIDSGNDSTKFFM